MVLGPPLLALAIAFLIASLELITSKYPRTFFLLRGSWALYSYAAIYGLIGFGITLAIDSVTRHGAITLEGPGVANPWVQAVVIGVSTKAFLHIRLFSVSTGRDSFPVGMETLVQIFEPWLLRTIELAHFNALRGFLESRAARYPDLDDMKRRIKSNVPKSFSQQERTAFEAERGCRSSRDRDRGDGAVRELCW